MVHGEVMVIKSMTSVRAVLMLRLLLIPVVVMVIDARSCSKTIVSESGNSC